MIKAVRAESVEVYDFKQTFGLTEQEVHQSSPSAFSHICSEPKSLEWFFKESVVKAMVLLESDLEPFMILCTVTCVIYS